MARDNRVNGIAPLVADRMEIGVADAAEQHLDLQIIFRRIALRN